MRVKLDERLVKKLLESPESGMGYQRVDVRLRDGRELRDLLVYNAEELDLPANAAGAEIADVIVRGSS